RRSCGRRAAIPLKVATRVRVPLGVPPRVRRSDDRSAGDQWSRSGAAATPSLLHRALWDIGHGDIPGVDAPSAVPRSQASRRRPGCRPRPRRRRPATRPSPLPPRAQPHPAAAVVAGHARERRPGVWELRAYAGRDPLTGRKRYETKTVRAVMTKREAQRAVDAYAVEVHGEPVGAAGVKFGDLLEKWFAIAGPRMVPAGQRETRWIINRRLGALALVPLDRLGGRTGTAILDEFYAALRDHGGLCRRRVEKCASRCEHGGGAPLSDASVVRTHVVVRAALEQAVRWGLIARNPAEHAYAGEPGADDVAPPAPGDVVRLFQLAEEDPEFVVFLVVASTTGQRRGRMLALKWEDLDLDGGVASFGHVISLGPDGPVRVEAGRGKRNRKGRRVDAPLDPAVTAILIAHRARCVARAALAGVELADDG